MFKKQRGFQIQDQKWVYTYVRVFLIPVLFGNSNIEAQKGITGKYFNKFWRTENKWELNYLVEDLPGIPGRYIKHMKEVTRGPENG